MNKKILYALILGFLLRGGIAQAQDPVFSQFYASPLQLNPAFAGSAMAPFVALNYRMQYPGFSNGGPAYSTFAGSYDQHLKGLNSGIGLSVMSDDAGQGMVRKTYASAHYSYKVGITENIAARIGVEAGFIQSTLDWNRLVFPDQIDASTGAYLPDGSKRPTSEVRPQQLGKTLFDMSMGLVVYGERFHGGFVAKHLATPDEGYINANQNLRIGLPVRFTLHGSYEIVVKKATRYKLGSFIAPTVLLVKQGDFAQFTMGSFLGLGPIVGGLWYRHAYTNSESVILMMGFKQDAYRISYSYDYTIGSLSGRTGGSHEISLNINLDPGAAKRVDISDCFKIFR
jgi:type IX secretion system PorP/SprF family membrane protein